MIKNIFFDFDGVICESVNIKTEAFYEMYLSYGEEIAKKIKKYHIENGGKPREEKFIYFHTQIIKDGIDEIKIQKLSSMFSGLVLKKIIKAPFVKGINHFLSTNNNQYRCFIISATPQKEILYICERKGISQYFHKICGSPKNKIVWAKELLKHFSLNPNETIFIGDALSDLNAALSNKLHFLLRKTNENRHMFDKDIAYTNDFTNLSEYLCKIK